MIAVRSGQQIDLFVQRPPTSTHRVSELKLKEPHAPGQPFEFDAKGELTIAGVTNKVAFPVAIQPVGKEQIKISGAAPVKMSDYGIKPPARLVEPVPDVRVRLQVEDPVAAGECLLEQGLIENIPLEEPRPRLFE